MDRLDMAIELIREARYERQRCIDYEREWLEAIGKGWEERINVDLKYTPRPSKALVNTNLKVARRILAQEYMK